MSNLTQQISELEAIQNQIDAETNQIDPTSFKDGVINVEKYLQSDIRILWILKEANSEEVGVNWRDYILDLNDGSGNLGEFSKTYPKLIYTSYGLLNKKKWQEIDYISDDPAIVSVIEQIAIINIKKSPGGARSNDADLAAGYNTFKPVVLKQIKAFKPNVIIGGNTLKFMHDDLQALYPDLEHYKYLKSSDLGVKKSSKANLVVFDAYHPQYTIDGNKYCNDIINTYWEING